MLKFKLKIKEIQKTILENTARERYATIEKLTNVLEEMSKECHDENNAKSNPKSNPRSNNLVSTYNEVLDEGHKLKSWLEFEKKSTSELSNDLDVIGNTSIAGPTSSLPISKLLQSLQTDYRANRSHTKTHQTTSFTPGTE